MAKPPATSLAPPPMPDDAGAPPDDSTDMGATADDTGDDSDPGSEDVLLTVCKEADGTYSLIKGDEEDADGADAAGSATAEGSGKQTFDSIGALLKGILDVLNEDKASGGSDGDANDQFQSGFDGGSPATPASPIPQKY